MGCSRIPRILGVARPRLVRDFREECVSTKSSVICTGAFNTGTCGLRSDNCDIRRVVNTNIGVTEGTIRNASTLITLSVNPVNRLLRPTNSVGFSRTCRCCGRRVLTNGSTSIVIFRAVASLCRLGTTILTTGRGYSGPVLAAVAFREGKQAFANMSPTYTTIALAKLNISTLNIGYSLNPSRLRPIISRVSGCAGLPLMVGTGTNLPSPGDGRCGVVPSGFTRYIYSLLGCNIGIVNKYYKAGPSCVTGVGSRITSERCRPRAGDISAAIYDSAAIIRVGNPEVVNREVGPANGGLFGRTLIRGGVSCVLARTLDRIRNNTRVLSIGMNRPRVSRGGVVIHILGTVRDIYSIPLRVSSAGPRIVRTKLHCCGNGPVLGSMGNRRRDLTAILPLIGGCNTSIIKLTLSRGNVPGATRNEFRVTGQVIRETRTINVSEGSMCVSYLALAISTRRTTYHRALRTLREMGARLNYGAYLNMSGVSFKLPGHRLIGEAFLAVTVRRKLSLPVVGPGIRSVANTMETFHILGNVSGGSLRFVGTCGSTIPTTPIGGTSDGISVFTTICGKLGGRNTTTATGLLRAASTVRIMGRVLVPTLSEINRSFRGGGVFLPRLVRDTGATRRYFSMVGGRLAGADKAPMDGNGVVITAMGNSVRSVNGGVMGILLSGCNCAIISLNHSISPRLVISATIRRGVAVVKLSTLVAAALGDVRSAVELMERYGRLRGPSNSDGYAVFINNTILAGSCTVGVNTSCCYHSTGRDISATGLILN